MFWWLSAEAARASCRKRRTRSALAANSSGSTLSATTRARPKSGADGGGPLPPAPRPEPLQDLVGADPVPRLERARVGGACIAEETDGGLLDEGLGILAQC